MEGATADAAIPIPSFTLLKKKTIIMKTIYDTEED